MAPITLPVLVCFGTTKTEFFSVVLDGFHPGIILRCAGRRVSLIQSDDHRGYIRCDRSRWSAGESRLHRTASPRQRPHPDLSSLTPPLTLAPREGSHSRDVTASSPYAHGSPYSRAHPAVSPPDSIAKCLLRDTKTFLRIFERNITLLERSSLATKLREIWVNPWHRTPSPATTTQSLDIHQSG